jgi:hypothetical protein
MSRAASKDSKTPTQEKVVSKYEIDMERLWSRREEGIEKDWAEYNNACLNDPTADRTALFQEITEKEQLLKDDIAIFDAVHCGEELSHEQVQRCFKLMRKAAQEMPSAACSTSARSTSPR